MPVKYNRYIVLFLCLFSFAFAKVWNVSVSDTIKSIQSAIDTAASGDTVLVGSSHQNVGPIEIIGKKIALISKGYLNNPGTYGIASGAALFDTLNYLPQLTLSSADSSVIMGLLIDKSDIGNGGGVLVQNSDHIHIEGVYFRANSLMLENSSLVLYNTRFYGLDSAAIDLISSKNSTLEIKKAVIKNSYVDNLISTGNGTELSVENLSVYDNVCAGELYKIGSSMAYFNFITSYDNSTPAEDWSFSSTWTSIRNSVLEFAPPLDIENCEVNYSALPGNYPGTGNLSADPLINSENDYPALLETSPCISAADPDTTGIPRLDILGHARPDPEWAPPDMGAYESERHMLLNDDNLFWISKGGDDIWGNGSNEYPFASLQAGIDYANVADTLILLPGTYMTNALIDVKPLTIGSQYLLSENRAYKDSVILAPDTSEANPIILVRNTDSLMLAGITLREGQGREFYNNYSFGGAIYCENSGLNLMSVDFKENSSKYSGGALYALESEVYATEVLFDNNHSYLGGAVSLSASTGYFSNVMIHDNVASSGGGIYLENVSKLFAYYLDLTGNAADNDLVTSFSKPAAISQYGGGIYAISSNLRLHNTLIADNHSVNHGSAIAQKYGTFYLLQSTVTENNSAAESTSAIYLNDLTGDAIIVNSILYDQNEDELILADCDVLADHAFIAGGEDAVIHMGAENNLDFESVLTGDPGLDEGYGLTLSSQCLNAGLTSYLLDDEYLLNYDASEYDAPAPHLGHNGAYPTAPFKLEFVVSSSIENIPEGYELLKAYPNPFNPYTTIEFNLAYSGDVRLRVFDLSGRLVSELVDKHLRGGLYKINFNASYLPSGIYIAQLVRNREIISSQKILLVK